MKASDIILAMQQDIHECMRLTMEVPKFIEMTQEQYDILFDSLVFVTRVTDGEIPPNTFSGIPIIITSEC